MSLLLVMIATALVAFILGRGSAWPVVRRLRAQLVDATWWLAHDSLTGLYNRNGLRAAHAAIAARGMPQPMIVVLLDLDDFKAVNDTHGHDAGDHLLITVADRVNEVATMHGGIAARLSGDEYAAVLPVRQHDLTHIADSFATMIAQPVPVSVDGTTVTITPTASVGLAVAETTDSFEEFALHRADTAMYHAKHHRGNSFAIYQPGMTMPAGKPRRGPRPRDLRQHGREVSA